MKKNEPTEPALLVLQSTQRTTPQIVNAAKVYANVRWRFEANLRETFATGHVGDSIAIQSEKDRHETCHYEGSP